jgi:hypothetical protein
VDDAAAAVAAAAVELQRIAPDHQGYVVGALCIGLTARGLEAVALALVGLWRLQVVIALVGIFCTKDPAR